jgi:hypothetical protein
LSTCDMCTYRKRTKSAKFEWITIDEGLWLPSKEI